MSDIILTAKQNRRWRPVGGSAAARRHGIAGIHDNGGNLESATYRIYKGRVGSNPTLSDSHLQLHDSDQFAVLFEEVDVASGIRSTPTSCHPSLARRK